MIHALWPDVPAGPVVVFVVFVVDVDSYGIKQLWKSGYFVDVTSALLLLLLSLFVSADVVDLPTAAAAAAGRMLIASQDILADGGVAGEEERRKCLFRGLKFFFGREVRWDFRIGFTHLRDDRYTQAFDARRLSGVLASFFFLSPQSVVVIKSWSLLQYSREQPCQSALSMMP